MDSVRKALVGLIGAILVGCLAAGPAVAAGRPLTISPAAGTPDASPDTQISILGVSKKRIESVRATGSVSGRAGGDLRRYSHGPGASFIPSAPFVEGEDVDLVVRIDGHQPIRRSFTIAHLGRIQPPLNLDKTQPEKLQHFVSEPRLIPPRISVFKRGTTKGNIFMTPLPSPVIHPGGSLSINPVGPGGPMIVDGNGNLVWFKQLERPDVAANLRIQRYRDRRVLTWWQGGVTPSAYGLGKGVIANRSYRTIKTVHAGNGYQMDIHEFTLAPGGSALFTIYSPVMVHLPGTPEGQLSPLLDSIIQEVDIDTGRVMWEWHAYGHVPLSQSYATPENSATYDAFHINSIQRRKHGRVLVSMRDTSAVYAIDKASGKILWRLGGKASDFRQRGDARFWLQHDAQLIGHQRISVFDDEAGPPQKAPASRGLVLRLHRKRAKATMVEEYLRSDDTSAQSEGSVQTRPGGNVFVGFGSTQFFSEFSPEGRLLYDAGLPKDDGSYRMYRYKWNATPKTLPAVAASRDSASRVSVYASWNGATDVARWQVLAGSGGGPLEPVGSARRNGFETRIRVSSSANAFAVRALDADGKVLATSARTHPS
jgi:arylsulfotransferase ASST